MTSPSTDRDVARLMFEAATERVQGQRSSVDELRSRSSTLLGTASIATSFLAGFALTDRSEPLTFFSFLGLVATAAVVIFVGLILRPTEGWVFGHEPEIIYQDYYLGDYEDSPGPMNIEKAHVYLARNMGGWVENNTVRLEKKFRQFELAVISVGVMVSAWTIDLILTAV